MDVNKLSAKQVYETINRVEEPEICEKKRKKKKSSKSHDKHPEKKRKIDSVNETPEKKRKVDSVNETKEHKKLATKLELPEKKNNESKKSKKKKKKKKSKSSTSNVNGHTDSKDQHKATTSDMNESYVSSENESVMFDEHWDNIDTIEHGEHIFQDILGSTKIKTFFESYWEKKPLFIPAESSDKFEDWFSCEELDNILTTDRVNFSEHLDATSYEGGVRETHNPEGRAYRSVVWDLYRSGCSIRMLCPQAFYHPLRMKLNFLQEYFGCFVGSNIYLTPPNTQGFAPHYDDIEAFVLQLEGTKHWRVYAPRNKDEYLPQYSSPNFSNDEIGKPILEKTLNPGDVLYFPRGYIHQADCPDNDQHSLHITVSTYQKHSWGDLLKKTLTLAIDKAMKEDLEFRRGLPVGFLTYMGRSHAKVKTASRLTQRDSFRQTFKQLTNRLCSLHMPMDLGCDELGKSLVKDSLPPILEASEAAVHVLDAGETWVSGMNQVCNVVELTPDTKIRLVRWSAVRAVESVDDESVAVYHCADNTNIYHEVDPQPMYLQKELGAANQEEKLCLEAFLRKAKHLCYCNPLSLDLTSHCSIFCAENWLRSIFKDRLKLTPAFDKLVTDFPDFTKIEDLPLTNLDEKMAFAASMYDRGLVITEGYLPLSEDNPDDSSFSL